LQESGKVVGGDSVASPKGKKAQITSLEKIQAKTQRKKK